MSDYKFKIGDWVEVGGSRCFIFDVDQNKIGLVERNGKACFYNAEYSGLNFIHTLTHLPNCDGWDWKDWRDKVDVGEGWRLLGENEPLVRGDEFKATARGEWFDSELSRDFDYVYRRRAEPPKPKYRPFASHEFKPHRNRWVRSVKTGVAGQIGSCGEHGVYAMDSFAFRSWESFVLNYVFDDGDEPCGVLDGAMDSNSKGQGGKP